MKRIYITCSSQSPRSAEAAEYVSKALEKRNFSVFRESGNRGVNFDTDVEVIAHIRAADLILAIVHDDIRSDPWFRSDLLEGHFRGNLALVSLEGNSASAAAENCLATAFQLGFPSVKAQRGAFFRSLYKEVETSDTLDQSKLWNTIKYAEIFFEASDRFLVDGAFQALTDASAKFRNRAISGDDEIKCALELFSSPETLYQGLLDFLNIANSRSDPRLFLDLAGLSYIFDPRIYASCQRKLLSLGAEADERANLSDLDQRRESLREASEAVRDIAESEVSQDVSRINKEEERERWQERLGKLVVFVAAVLVVGLLIPANGWNISEISLVLNTGTINSSPIPGVGRAGRQVDQLKELPSLDAGDPVLEHRTSSNSPDNREKENSAERAIVENTELPEPVEPIASMDERPSPLGAGVAPVRVRLGGDKITYMEPEPPDCLSHESIGMAVCKVASNQTLWEIAEHICAHRAHWTALLARNERFVSTPLDLETGSYLVVPEQCRDKAKR